MRHAPANGGRSAIGRWSGVVLITTLAHSGIALAEETAATPPVRLNEPNAAVAPEAAGQETSVLRDVRQPVTSGDEHGTRIARSGRSVLDKLKVNGI